MNIKSHTLTPRQIRDYAVCLREQERAENTVKQYTNYLSTFFHWLDGRPLAKTELIAWKKQLSETYAAATVNTMLAAVNGFLRFMGWDDTIVKLLKVQKTLFRDENRELDYREYERLVRAAEEKGDLRLSLLIQTICATGKSIDRSNIWRAMKRLCNDAGIDQAKVFPHNLRHLFARRFYAQEKDTDRLTDILGIPTSRHFSGKWDPWPDPWRAYGAQTKRRPAFCCFFCP